MLAPEVAARVGMTRADLERIMDRESAELERRTRLPGGAGRWCPSPGGRRSSSTTAWRPASRSSRRCERCAGAAPRRIVVAVPVGRPRRSRCCASEADEVVCLNVPRGAVRRRQLVRGLPQTSDDEVASCSRPPRPSGAKLAAPDGARAVAASRRPARQRAARRPRVPAERAAWCSSPTAAAAAGTARATAPSPRRSTGRARHAAVRPAHARRGAPTARSVLRHRAARRAAARRARAGRGAQPSSRACRSATSAPAPARPRRCWPRPTPATAWAPSSPAAAGPISPRPRLAGCARRRCSIVGGDDDVVLELNRQALRRSCAARAELDDRARRRRTCSRSRARWRRSRGSPATGSRGT